MSTSIILLTKISTQTMSTYGIRTLCLIFSLRSTQEGTTHVPELHWLNLRAAQWRTNYDNVINYAHIVP